MAHSSKLNHSSKWARKSLSLARSATASSPLLSLNTRLSTLRHRMSRMGWSEGDGVDRREVREQREEGEREEGRKAHKHERRMLRDK